MRRQLILPDCKLCEIRLALQGANSRNELTKWEMQRHAGHLNFAARVEYGWQTFLHRLLDNINSIQRPHHHKRITQSMRADLQWWINFMETFNGITFFVDSSPNLPLFYWCMLNWWSQKHFQSDWFYTNWIFDPPHLPDYHINKLELYTILLAICRWHGQMRHKWMIVYTDNTVTQFAINKGKVLAPKQCPGYASFSGLKPATTSD